MLPHLWLWDYDVPRAVGMILSLPPPPRSMSGVRLGLDRMACRTLLAWCQIAAVCKYGVARGRASTE